MGVAELDLANAVAVCIGGEWQEIVQGSLIAAPLVRYGDIVVPGTGMSAFQVPLYSRGGAQWVLVKDDHVQAMKFATGASDAER